MRVLSGVFAIPLLILAALFAVSYGTDSRLDYFPVNEVIDLKKPVKAKVVLVNVWASICRPCLKELPELNRLKGKFKDNELEIIAYADLDTASAKTYIARHPELDKLIWAMPSAWEDWKLVSEDLVIANATDFELAVPFTYLVVNNRIINTFAGYSKVNMEAMEEIITRENKGSRP
ncbi:MAG: TlpA disulfide reductase family protein [Bacteroidota bacterium]